MIFDARHRSGVTLGADVGRVERVDGGVEALATLAEVVARDDRVLARCTCRLAAGDRRRCVSPDVVVPVPVVSAVPPGSVHPGGILIVAPGAGNSGT